MSLRFDVGYVEKRVTLRAWPGCHTQTFQFPHFPSPMSTLHIFGGTEMRKLVS
jgi:hypothetical protein